MSQSCLKCWHYMSVKGKSICERYELELEEYEPCLFYTTEPDNKYKLNKIIYSTLWTLFLILCIVLSLYTIMFLFSNYYTVTMSFLVGVTLVCIIKVIYSLVKIAVDKAHKNE
jgi:hypothetical protein